MTLSAEAQLERDPRFVEQPIASLPSFYAGLRARGISITGDNGGYQVCLTFKAEWSDGYWFKPEAVCFDGDTLEEAFQDMQKGMTR